MRSSVLLLCSLLAIGSHAQAETAVATFLNASADDVVINPHDVELSKDGSKLYVSDVGNDRIAVLDATTLKFSYAFGTGELDGPHDVDLGHDGNLYIADSGGHRVAVYASDDKDAKVVKSITGPWRSPEGVLKHPSGALITTGAWSNNIAIYTGGQFVKQAGGLAAPHDIEPDAQGNFWVADASNNRIVYMTPSLVTVRVLEGPTYGFKGPRYLALGPDGTLYVADKYSHRVLLIDADSGVLKGIIGTGKAGLGPGLLATPEGVAVRGDILWISDTSNNRIVRYELSSRAAESAE